MIRIIGDPDNQHMDYENLKSYICRSVFNMFVTIAFLLHNYESFLHVCF